MLAVATTRRPDGPDPASRCAMTALRTPVADRLRRIASVRLGRPPGDTSDPRRAARLVATLGRTADPPITDPTVLRALADALSGRIPELPPEIGGPVAAALGLPADALDPAADFSRTEDALLRGFLGERGVVDVRSCRGGHGRTALIELLGLVDRAAAGSGAPREVGRGS